MARVGSQLVLSITAMNPTGSSRTLALVQIENRFLRHFKLLALSPPAIGQTSALGATGWAYQESLEPGEHFTVKVRLEATKPGLAEGKASAITSRFSSAITPVSVCVVEPPAFDDGPSPESSDS